MMSVPNTKKNIFKTSSVLLQRAACLSRDNKSLAIGNVLAFGRSPDTMMFYYLVVRSWRRVAKGGSMEGIGRSGVVQGEAWVRNKLSIDDLR